MALSRTDDLLDHRINRLRGYFAFMILIGHAMDISILHVAGRAALVDTTARLGGALHGFFSSSWVVGFIVVSGYCIARSCERQKDRFSVPRYFVMRATRIYPLLIVAALMTLAVET